MMLGTVRGSSGLPWEIAAHTGVAANMSHTIPSLEAGEIVSGPRTFAAGGDRSGGLSSERPPHPGQSRPPHASSEDSELPLGASLQVIDVTSAQQKWVRRRVAMPLTTRRTPSPGARHHVPGGGESGPPGGGMRQ